jgi:hypothetical protein
LRDWYPSWQRHRRVFLSQNTPRNDWRPPPCAPSAPAAAALPGPGPATACWASWATASASSMVTCTLADCGGGPAALRSGEAGAPAAAAGGPAAVAACAAVFEAAWGSGRGARLLSLARARERARGGLKRGLDFSSPSSKGGKTGAAPCPGWRRPARFFLESGGGGGGKRFSSLSLSLSLSLWCALVWSVRKPPIGQGACVVECVCGRGVRGRAQEDVSGGARESESASEKGRGEQPLALPFP